eukprot:scaffold232840_cov27-Tisochrysis_lutea.AAC.1
MSSNSHPQLQSAPVSSMKSECTLPAAIGCCSAPRHRSRRSSLCTLSERLFGDRGGLVAVEASAAGGEAREVTGGQHAHHVHQDLRRELLELKSGWSRLRARGAAGAGWLAQFGGSSPLEELAQLCRDRQ